MRRPLATSTCTGRQRCSADPPCPPQGNGQSRFALRALATILSRRAKCRSATMLRPEPSAKLRRAQHLSYFGTVTINIMSNWRSLRPVSKMFAHRQVRHGCLACLILAGPHCHRSVSNWDCPTAAKRKKAPVSRGFFVNCDNTDLAAAEQVSEVAPHIKSPKQRQTAVGGV